MNNIDLSKLKEYSKDNIHEMIINGEIDHDFICEYISKRDKVYNMLIDKVNELQEKNNQLKDKMDKVFSRITLWKMEDITMETARVLDDLLEILKGEPNNV